MNTPGEIQYPPSLPEELPPLPNDIGLESEDAVAPDAGESTSSANTTISCDSDDEDGSDGGGDDEDVSILYDLIDLRTPHGSFAPCSGNSSSLQSKVSRETATQTRGLIGKKQNSSAQGDSKAIPVDENTKRSSLKSNGGGEKKLGRVSFADQGETSTLSSAGYSSIGSEPSIALASTSAKSQGYAKGVPLMTPSDRSKAVRSGPGGGCDWSLWSVWDSSIMGRKLSLSTKADVQSAVNDVLVERVGDKDFVPLSEGEHFVVVRITQSRAMDGYHKLADRIVLEAEEVKFSLDGDDCYDDSEDEDDMEDSSETIVNIHATSGLAQLLATVINCNDILVIIGGYHVVDDGKRVLALNWGEWGTDIIRVSECPRPEDRSMCLVEKIIPSGNSFDFTYFALNKTPTTSKSRTISQTRKFSIDTFCRDVRDTLAFSHNRWDFPMPISQGIDPNDIYDLVLSPELQMPSASISFSSSASTAHLPSVNPVSPTIPLHAPGEPVSDDSSSTTDSEVASTPEVAIRRPTPLERQYSRWSTNDRDPHWEERHQGSMNEGENPRHRNNAGSMYDRFFKRSTKRPTANPPADMSPSESRLSKWICKLIIVHVLALVMVLVMCMTIAWGINCKTDPSPLDKLSVHQIGINEPGLWGVIWVNCKLAWSRSANSQEPKPGPNDINFSDARRGGTIDGTGSCTKPLEDEPVIIDGECEINFSEGDEYAVYPKNEKLHASITIIWTYTKSAATSVMEWIDDNLCFHSVLQIILRSFGLDAIIPL